MKRCQVHLHVEDLARSMSFYSKLFAAEPARVESDCAKWMLEEPRVNFAISTSGRQAGIGHLGLQTDDAAEIAELKVRSETADMALLDEGETTCCYARSEKHWVTDPQGIAWEHFHTLGDIPVFNEGQKAEAARLGRDVQAHSAGSVPSGRINPNALEVLADAGVDTRGCRSKSWDEISRHGAPPRRSSSRCAAAPPPRRARSSSAARAASRSKCIGATPMRRMQRAAMRASDAPSS